MSNYLLTKLVTLAYLVLALCLLQLYFQPLTALV